MEMVIPVEFDPTRHCIFQHVLFMLNRSHIKNSSPNNAD